MAKRRKLNFETEPQLGVVEVYRVEVLADTGERIPIVPETIGTHDDVLQYYQSLLKVSGLDKTLKGEYQIMVLPVKRIQLVTQEDVSHLQAHEHLYREASEGIEEAMMGVDMF